MSVVQLAAVFRASRSKGSARLVLLALADVANDEGEVTAYARSQKILARKANVDQGSVRRAIDRLEELGELKVLSQGDGRRPSDYRITLGEGAQDEGAQAAAPAPAGRAPSPGETRAQGAQAAAPITPSLPGLPPPDPTRADPEPEGFAEFWAAYPRRVAKAAARKAYASALKRTSVAEILAGAERYARERRAQDEKFTAHPASWLNADRWADEGGGGARSGPRQQPQRPAGPEGRVAEL